MPTSTAEAPGRCTLVGEHVDYADGVVLCAAVDLGVAVALRPSVDGCWRVVSGGRRIERLEASMRGDVGDRPLAAMVALGARGIPAVPAEIAVAASLPESAGLASSAALCCAAIVAALRLGAERLAAGELAAIALHAEHDIVGVPCGPLDQFAVVAAPASGVLRLDCRDLSWSPVDWLRGVSLVACHTGATHDVGGAGYRLRRAQADVALRTLGAMSWRDADAGDIARHLDGVLAGRARHIVSETARAVAGAAALEHGDARELGRLMSASHRSLRDDYEVSTPALDAAVAAATSVDGCHGARLVGAGFGGTAIALVDDAAADDCVRAMRRAVGGNDAAEAEGVRTWRLRPSPGLAQRAPDVVT